MFPCLFFALEVFSSVIAGFSWEFPSIGSAWLRFSARYELAFLLSIPRGGTMVGLRLALAYLKQV
jgi:hypothetical protein